MEILAAAELFAYENRAGQEIGASSSRRQFGARS